jgi:hypothetical protein|tara:strand:+ start:168 stop:347 length:180 start_codon:yes stop_codon:yes gene_type:complete
MARVAKPGKKKEKNGTKDLYPISKADIQRLKDAASDTSKHSDNIDFIKKLAARFNKAKE